VYLGLCENPGGWGANPASKEKVACESDHVISAANKLTPMQIESRLKVEALQSTANFLLHTLGVSLFRRCFACCSLSAFDHTTRYLAFHVGHDVSLQCVGWAAGCGEAEGWGWGWGWGSSWVMVRAWMHHVLINIRPPHGAPVRLFCRGS